jgi:hypothetical protein
MGWLAPEGEPWADQVREAADEIQLLRSALALACGLLSTYEDHAMFQPDQLMQQFIKEASRG